MSVLIALLVFLEEGSYAEGSNLIAGFKLLPTEAKAEGRRQRAEGKNLEPDCDPS
jgi:hypothetical protein